MGKVKRELFEPIQYDEVHRTHKEMTIQDEIDYLSFLVEANKTALRNKVKELNKLVELS